ncbi:MAG: 6-phosphofructokinase [Clostridia bacterium]|nr:6-phosphofructokinase [Clostridia bacterium]
MIKTVGVLTSGGDAPGMNAAIRAVVRTGIAMDLRVMGIYQGYQGLINGEIKELTLRSVSDTLQRGGTFLQSARCKAFMTEKGVKSAIEVAKVFGMDAIVVIGGDGSFRGARELSRMGMTVVGIPGTIDNDIDCTDYTIGYDTAMNTAMEAIDKIRDTASSHQRCSIVEVMGRGAGHIALSVSIANGAEAVIVPEKEYSIDEDIVKPIFECRNRGKNHYIIILAEGVGKADEIASAIHQKTGIDARVSILGYIQRGGSPTARDRIEASRMGAHAVEILAKGCDSRIVALKDGMITDIPIEEALQMKKEISKSDLALTKVLSL